VRAGKGSTLDGAESTDDDEIVKFLWEFGDGATGTGRKVSHTWAAPGTYEVTLWVTDERGAQGSVTHRLTVR
jgi:PKD repeat protein